MNLLFFAKKHTFEVDDYQTTKPKHPIILFEIPGSRWRCGKDAARLADDVQYLGMLPQEQAPPLYIATFLVGDLILNRHLPLAPVSWMGGAYQDICEYLMMDVSGFI